MPILFKTKTKSGWIIKTIAVCFPTSRHWRVLSIESGPVTSEKVIQLWRNREEKSSLVQSFKFLLSPLTSRPLIYLPSINLQGCMMFVLNLLLRIIYISTKGLHKHPVLLYICTL